MKEYIFARPDEAEDTAKRDAFCRGELIRCKDCKHHCYVNKIPYCNLIDYGYGWKDDDFCSRAERKE